MQPRPFEQVNPFLRDDGVIASILGTSRSGSIGADDKTMQETRCFRSLAATEPQLTLQELLLQAPPRPAQRFSSASSVYSTDWSSDSSFGDETTAFTSTLQYLKPQPPTPQKPSGKLHKLVVCRNFLQLQKKRIAQHRTVQSLLVKLSGRDCRNDAHWCDEESGWDTQTATEPVLLVEKQDGRGRSRQRSQRYGYF
ncbi:hypothetical protein BCR37DRAFT_393344 [Protomyces lactucae-debilis]|uniref:Uncharacterized protein n=1 Tax=Protomyces lactucae-debilis TaxID=2754530 RepID=A0A1Y2FDU2_PROLT|nr:uncharacterized protein BCR37DRAFT_393344 [Protomyces lactucae-debilis]ORY81486.1 hypothetical protein BCR37DRAFT_393344 [Protomyces lactucae-debilis]